MFKFLWPSLIFFDYGQKNLNVFKKYWTCSKKFEHGQNNIFELADGIGIRLINPDWKTKMAQFGIHKNVLLSFLYLYQKKLSGLTCDDQSSSCSRQFCFSSQPMFCSTFVGFETIFWTDISDLKLARGQNNIFAI